MIPHPLKFQSAICKALGAIALRRRRAQNAEFLCTYHVICDQMTSLSQSPFSEHKSTSLRMGLMFEIAGSAKLVSQIFWWCEVAAVFGCSSVNIQNSVVKEKLSERLKCWKHTSTFRWITCWEKFLPWNFQWIDCFVLELPNHKQYSNSVCCRMGFQAW